MNTVTSGLSAISLFLFLVFPFSLLASAHNDEQFLQCFSLYHPEESSTISKVIYTPKNSLYSSVLEFSIRNPRFNTSATPKPVVIIAPTTASHVQGSVICSRKHGLQIRVRSGGHDFEGLSYVSSIPFVILDLINLRNISVDVASKTAWVQSGATLGELYYRIAEKSTTLAFPAGTCPTVGVGGFLSGGGYGFMFRNFGLATDHVIDAILIDVDGRILDRALMGEDLFWAIRGGGGNTFGIVISWKINLVEVPPIVTAFTVHRTLEQDAFNLVNQWQYVAHKLPNELHLEIILTKVNSTQDGNTTIVAIFMSLYLGRADELMLLMQENFPKLGIVKEDCIEMSWIESSVYLVRLMGYTSLDQMLNRIPILQYANKRKVDYAREPIPKVGLNGLFQWLYKVDVATISVILIPYGGKMSQILDTSTPFPHRVGTLYKILYTVDIIENSERCLDMIRAIYEYMTPYVSKNPRSAYVNYRDLDIGVNNEENTSNLEAIIWGVKYFGKNFDRLVKVKTKVDPTNFFRNEQSIPPLLNGKISWKEDCELSM